MAAERAIGGLCAPHKKGGRHVATAAFKSREETPKEGMCGTAMPHRNNIGLIAGSCKRIF